MRCFPGVFSRNEIENAKKYKYNGSDDSILVRLFLKRFWDWCVTFAPLSVAPNTLTFMGFLCGVFSFILSYYFSDGLTHPIPRWVCLVNSISLLAYQILDNIDGRQARRTGSSSPLGQFFDHGCDALTSVLELLKLAATLNLGNSVYTFGFVLMMGTIFFLASLEENVTDAFYIGVINGPDEGLTAMVVVQLIVAIFPQSRIAFSSWPVMVMFSVAFALTVLSIMINIIRHSLKEGFRARRALFGILPGLISLVIVITNAVQNPENIKCLWFIIGGTYVVQYHAQLTIAAHLVNRSPWRLLFEPTIFILWAFALSPFVLKIENLAKFWGSFLVTVFAEILIFDLHVVSGLSRGLEIPIFTIKQRPPQEEKETKHQEPSASDVPIKSSK